MKTRTILQIAACLLAGLTALVGCQKMQLEENPADPSELGASADSLWTLTVEATKEVPGQAGDDSWDVAGEGTKALDLVSGTPDHLDAYWRNTETVKVYKDGTLLGTLNVTPGEGVKPTVASLSGTITTSGLAVGNELTLLIPRESWDYSGQTGAAPSADGPLATNFDYAMATVTIRTIVGSTVTTTSATFTNQQSIYRFSFSAGSALSVKSIIVSAANGQLVRSRAYSGSWTPTFGSLTVTPTSATAEPLYISLRNDSTEADSYSFVITDTNDALYLAYKDIPAGVLDAPGKFISATAIPATQPDFSPASGTTVTAY